MSGQKAGINTWTGKLGREIGDKVHIARWISSSPGRLRALGKVFTGLSQLSSDYFPTYPNLSITTPHLQASKVDCAVGPCASRRWNLYISEEVMAP